MTHENALRTVGTELETGIALAKCQKCGCMINTLQQLSTVLPTVGTHDVSILSESVSAYLKRIHPTQYTCLGCEHCYPAVALNAFGLAFPTLSQTVADLSCEFRVSDEHWPPVAGEYFVLDSAASVAVSTLANVDLAEQLAHRKPNGLAIVGKTETENIGLDKIIKNVVSSSTLRYLIVTGTESAGHMAGQTLLALAAHGVDDQGRVIGSLGKRSVLRNVSPREIQAFREQVHVIDMIGCEIPDMICLQIDELAQQATIPCDCNGCSEKSPITISTASRVSADELSETVKLDEAGYFVIIPLVSTGVINVEHYTYDHSLLRVIEGTTSRAVYNAIINNGWVTELSHAAYLGKELTKAELSLQHGFKYVQDGA